MTPLFHPFDKGGTWFRCALHAHTTNSDGQLTPEQLVRHYELAGFDVLAITDHGVRTEAASSERLLVVPSAELNAWVEEPRRLVHVLALGIDAQPDLGGSDDSLQGVVAWTAGHGGVPYLAHTYWSGVRPGQFEACEGLVGLEVYNAGCELEVGRGTASLHWDEVLELGRPLLALATDDSHYPAYDSGFAWVWARCAERTQAAVLAALREGSFYSSSGPRIHELEVEEDAVTVRCSPASSVTLYAGAALGARANAGRLGLPHRARVLERDEDGAILACRLELPRGAPYGRVEVEGARAGRAWTNPLWLRA